MSDVGGVGDIYCCGRASQGKLRPPADHLRARKVSALFGKYDKAALLEDGRVFWLDGGASKDLNFKITDVKQIDFGEGHALVLKQGGQVYSWGIGALGQLGIGAKGVALQPQLQQAAPAAAAPPGSATTGASDLYQVWPLENVHIKQVSCGGEHSAALAENGDLYLWGRGYEGQLGMAAKGLSLEENDRVSSIQLVPRLVPAFIKRPIKAVSCGHRYTAVVTVSGEVWTWGEGGCGQLGYGRPTKQTKPKLAIAKDPETGAAFASVSCGFAHTMALTSEGRVYAWGLNNYGQLGLGDDNKHDGPCRVPLDVTIADAQAVGHSSGALSVDGALFTWGSGAQGKLYHGDATACNKAVMKPKAVAAFEGQYVTRFVLADNNAYVFTPAQVRSLSLRYDPLVGGSDIQLSGIGFFDSPSLVVRFQPVGQAIARAAMGTFVWDKITNRKYISAKTPKFGKPGDIVVELSLNGQDFTDNGLTYRCYSQPEIKTITPRYSNVSGGTVLKLEGEGLFDSPDVRVKFVESSDEEEEEENGVVVEGQVVCEFLGRNFDPLTQQEFDEYKTYLTCVAPAFATSSPKPVTTRVEVAMNGAYFEPVILGEEEEETEDVFIYHEASIKQIKPASVPAEGGLMLEVHGASFFEGVSVRIGIYYGEEVPQQQIKYAVVPAVVESSTVLRCKVPSTRYILGRDETKADSYRAQLDVMAGTELLTTEPLSFNYYNDPLLALTPSRGPLAGDTLLTLASTDRPILPTAQPLIRFFSDDGSLDVTLPGTVVKTTVQAPDGEQDKYVITVRSPALPAQLHPPAPPTDPQQPPAAAPTFSSVSVSFALNGITYSKQVLSFYYYRLPVMKELSPVDGVGGDRIIIKGTGFFSSPLIRVSFKVGEGENDTCVTDATFNEGEPTQLSVVLPTLAPGSTSKPLPNVLVGLGLAMNGQDFVPVADVGSKTGIKFTFLDPNKPRKKK